MLGFTSYVMLLNVLLMKPVVAASWLVEPNMCVTQTLGETCVMQVEFQYIDLADGTYCVWVAEQQLGCWQRHALPSKLSLSLKSDTQIKVTDNNNQPLLLQTLQVRSMQGPKVRRRVRNPWSVF